MKAESIEQIREHLAKGGEVVACTSDCYVKTVDDGDWIELEDGRCRKFCECQFLILPLDSTPKTPEHSMSETERELRNGIRAAKRRRLVMLKHQVEENQKEIAELESQPLHDIPDRFR